LLYAVRVRGIYSTALSVLLHEKGFLIADASKILQSRLNLPVVQRAPEVTVKNTDDLDYILVIGYPWEAGEKVFNTIRDSLKYPITRYGKIGLNTIIDGVSLGNCKLHLENLGEITLHGTPCPEEGEIVRASIVREALESGRYPIARRELRLVGMHTIVTYPGRGVSFSEHIRSDEEKAKLLSILSRKKIEDLHIHFRSGAKLANEAILEQEITELAREAKRLAEEKPSQPRIVRRGEFIGLIGITPPDKELLDSYRSRITTTIDKHHSLKSLGNEISNLVDCAESVYNEETRIKGIQIAKFLSTKNLNKKVILIHKKPDGSTIKLGPYIVKTMQFTDESIELNLEKTIRRKGILDGLGIEKKPGDIVQTTINTKEWYIIHKYYDSRTGKLLGIYVNINTPPEIGVGYIKYFDLYIDVIKIPGEEAKIIDLDQLEMYWKNNFISKKLYERALVEAEKVKNKINNNYNI